MAGFTTLTIPAALTPKAGASVTLRHAETKHADGSLATDPYYPSTADPDPCNMPAWYEGKWSECANQTDMYIFGSSSHSGDGGDGGGGGSGGDGGGGGGGGGDTTYTPSFTYHGFRFVELVLKGFSSDFTPTKGTVLLLSLAAKLP
jgi:hypothetical protein